MISASFLHAKMITLGSRCLTGSEPVYCLSAVAGCACDAADWLFGQPIGRLAGLQRVGGDVILYPVCVGQGLAQCCRCAMLLHTVQLSCHPQVLLWFRRSV